MRKRENEGNFIAVFRAWDDFADFWHGSTKWSQCLYIYLVEGFDF